MWCNFTSHITSYHAGNTLGERGFLKLMSEFFNLVYAWVLLNKDDDETTCNMKTIPKKKIVISFLISLYLFTNWIKSSLSPV